LAIGDSNMVTIAEPLIAPTELASEKLDSSKKMREATAKRQSDKNVSKPVLKSEENKKSTFKRKVREKISNDRGKR